MDASEDRGELSRGRGNEITRLAKAFLSRRPESSSGMEPNVTLPTASDLPQDRRIDQLNISAPTPSSGGNGGLLAQISGNPFFTAVG